MKTVSLKIDDSISGETDKILSSKKIVETAILIKQMSFTTKRKKG